MYLGQLYQETYPMPIPHHYLSRFQIERGTLQEMAKGLPYERAQAIAKENIAQDPLYYQVDYEVIARSDPNYFHPQESSDFSFA